VGARTTPTIETHTLPPTPGLPRHEGILSTINVLGSALSRLPQAAGYELQHVRKIAEHDRHYGKALIRKVDKRLLPILGALYSIALIDRINVSAARVVGIGDDLDLAVGDRWSTALLVFFIPYFVFELPSNMVLRKVGSANWLSLIAFAWSTVMLGQGFVDNWHELAACRPC